MPDHLKPQHGARYLLELVSSDVGDDRASYRCSVFTPTERYDTEATIDVEGGAELMAPPPPPMHPSSSSSRQPLVGALQAANKKASLLGHAVSSAGEVPDAAVDLAIAVIGSR